MALVALAVFALDQLSKHWVAATYMLDFGDRVAVAPFLNFTYALNTGVNFSLFASDSASQQYLLAGVALVISIGLVIWSVRAGRSALSLGVGLVVGGALANALDRLRVGGVIDFINMDCCGINNPYAFNLADVAIFAGAIGIALFGFGDSSRKNKPAANKD